MASPGPGDPTFDTIEGAFQTADSVALAADLTEKLVDGFVGGFGSAIGGALANALLQQIFPNSGPNAQVLDAISKLEKSIEKWLNDLKAEIANEIQSQSILSNINSIITYVGNSETYFEEIPQNLQPNASPDAITNTLHITHDAVTQFHKNITWWEVTWAPALAYNDTWSKELDPPNKGNTVFFYHYALPQYIRAIGHWITAMEAFSPSDITTYKQDLRNSIADLYSYDRLIRASIVGTRLPTESDIAHATDPSYATSWGSPWNDDYPDNTKWYNGYWGDPTLWPFGAVETYSAFNNVGSYVPFFPYKFYPSSDVSQNVLKLIVLRVENQKKQLYLRLGFPSVCKTARGLQRLIGDPLSPAQPYELWSLRNVLSKDFLGISLNGSGALRSIVIFLSSTPPYCGGKLYPDGQYPPAPLPKTFRGIFVPPGGPSSLPKANMTFRRAVKVVKTAPKRPGRKNPKHSRSKGKAEKNTRRTSTGRKRAKGRARN